MKFNSQSLWNLALQHLSQLRTSYGFAASEADTGHYATLFGRDSLWMLIFLLEALRLAQPQGFAEWVESAAEDIIRALCTHQGTEYRDLNEEQPGKIIHEYWPQLDPRVAKMGIGFERGQSYSGFDQTFLFVIAYRAFVDLFPTHDVVEEAWPHIERALTWIETCADDDGDGLFSYSRRNERNHLHQAWRDSFDSLVAIGINIPPPPIAWLSFQAYGYRAFVDAASLYERRGVLQRGRELQTKAEVLKREVHQHFWLEPESCFAIALDGTKIPVPMVSSDAGHALWSGIVDSSHEVGLVRRLMQPDMMTAFGLRTLSSASPFFAPFSYHRGNVWPFDNAIFAMGLLEKGYRDNARRIIESVAAAIMNFGSPVELYLVLDRALFVDPEVAAEQVLLRRRPHHENQNQGWSAAGLAYMAAALAHYDNIDLVFTEGASHG